MPIRFRCPHCSRLLGIARRKAGTQTTCPQCGEMMVVPKEDQPLDLDGIDDVENPAARPETVRQTHPPQPAKTATATRPTPPPAPKANGTPRPGTAPVPTPVAPVPKSVRKRKPGDDPLFEEDLDAILGFGDRSEADEEEQPKARPVSGKDALSLDEEPGKLVLTPQKATLVVVAVVVLLGLAFAAGFLIASNL